MSACLFYLKNMPKSIEQLQVNTLVVLIFCFEFQEVSHLTCDLSQAEQMHKMTSISLKMVEIVILSENSCHLSVAQLVTTVIFLSA